MPSIRAQVVAQGIPGAGAITQVGTFHRGSPIHDKATLEPLHRAGDGPRPAAAARRQLVELRRHALASGRGAGRRAFARRQPRPRDGGARSGDRRRTGGQRRRPGADLRQPGRARSSTASTTRQRRRPRLPSSSLPLGISINSGNGRPWIANAPDGRERRGDDHRRRSQRRAAGRRRPFRSRAASSRAT